ncbi:MAG TPA: flavodoxin family protein [Coriobacteriia bacterium]
MKVVAVNGSARKGGNTAQLIDAVFVPLRESGVECELVELAAKDVRGCIGCRKCFEAEDRQCHGRKDFINEVLPKLWEADGILLGSPTYFADVSAEMKALIERAGYVSMANGGLLAKKVGAGVVAVRRGGGIHVFDSLNHLFMISQMVVVGSTYWNLGYGRESGDVQGDEEAMRNMAHLGTNMAWLLGKLAE